MNVMTSALAPATYVIYPGHGLCVVSAHRNFTYDGLSFPAVEFRPKKTPATVVTKPISRLWESGVRPPANPEKIEAGLKAVFSSGRKKRAGGMWSKRKATYEAQISLGDVRSLAAVVCDIFAPYKKKDTPLPRGGKYSGEINISYSERQIVEKVLDLLGEEISLVTGLTETGARQEVLQCALIPGYASHLSLPKGVNALDRMEEKQFKAMFGVSTKQAANGDARTLAVATMKPREQDGNLYTPRSVLRVVAEPKNPPHRAMEKTKPASMARAPVRGAASKRGALPDDPAIRAVYLEEVKHMADRGTSRGTFNLAVTALDAQELRVLSQHDLRLKSARRNMADIAAGLGIEIKEAVAIRNRAAEKMRAAIQAKNLSAENSNLFSPYVAPVKKTPVARRLHRVSDGDMAEVRDDNRDLVLAELPYSEQPGSSRSLLLRSSKILGPDKFRILAQSLLRAPADRVSLEKLAADMKRPLEEITALRKEAEGLLGLKLDVSSPKPRMPISRERYARWEGAERRAAGPVPKMSRPVAVPKPGLSREERFLAKFPEHNRAIAAAELPYLPKWPALRRLFVTAGTALSANEFQVLSQHDLRHGRHRKNIADIDAAKGMGLEDAIALRNRAASKFNDAVPVKPPNLSGHRSFRPYTPPLEKLPRPPKPKLSREEKILLGIPGKNRALFAAEGPNISFRGIKRGAFLKAAEILEPDEFRVITQSALRLQAQRIGYETLAQQMERPLDEVIEIRNRAAEQLRLALKPTGQSTSKFFFRPYAPPVERAPRVLRPKRTRDERILAKIAEHNRSVALEELPHLPKYEAMRKVFVQAGKILQADELSILSQHDFRVRPSRIKMAQIASAMGLSIEEAIIIRNNAAEKLDRAMPVKQPRVSGHSAFRAYKPPKETIHRAPKEPAVRKAPLESKRLSKAAAGAPKAEHVSIEAHVLAEVPEDNRALYAAEMQYMGRKGAARSLLLSAAKVLGPEEFRVIGQSLLRAKEDRVSLAQLADDMGKSLEETAALRRAAERAIGLGGDAPQRPAAPFPVPQPAAKITPSPPVHVAAAAETPPPVSTSPRVIPLDVRAVMQREAQKVPGLHRALFEQAAEHLSADELSVFTMARLRKQQERIPLRHQARRDKAPLPQIVDLYNSAVSKLWTAFGEASSHARSGLFDPHPVTAEKGLLQVRGNRPS